MSPSGDIDYSVFDGLLIHPVDVFKPATVKARFRPHGAARSTTASRGGC